MWNAKNGQAVFDGKTMDYICFGEGRRTIVMIPGLGDGLQTVRGKAGGMAFMYRSLSKDYKVYMFSRANELKMGDTTRDMAGDLAEAMCCCGTGKADIIGVSQGGMIAQWLAIDHPEMVRKLVLTVTCGKSNQMVRENADRWIRLANEGEYGKLLADTAEHSYTERYLKKARLVLPLVSRMGRRIDFTRFLIQAEACKNHDASGELRKILCPTLIIGADHDQIVGDAAEGELADQIADSTLYIYEGYGHGVYEEAADWIPRIKEFLLC